MGGLSGRPHVSLFQSKPLTALIATLADLLGDEAARRLWADAIVWRADRIEAARADPVHAEVAIAPFPGCVSPACARADARLGSRTQRPGE